jgi:hypothetical protein
VESGVERVSERHIAGVTGESRPRLAAHVRVAYAGRRIGEAEMTRFARGDIDSILV